MADSEGLQPAVVPMGLSNLWGSYFSRVEVRNGEAVAMVRPFRRGIFSRVGLRVGDPLVASKATLERLHSGVRALID
ncbi:MAG: glycerol acyltransferase, partial [Hydrogenophaga sp.]|nr:glycerol acyltransferase [Hydrogenophaga sp.]